MRDIPVSTDCLRSAAAGRRQPRTAWIGLDWVERQQAAAAEEGDQARAKRRSETDGSTRQLHRSISPREGAVVDARDGGRLCRGCNPAISQAGALTSSRSWPALTRPESREVRVPGLVSDAADGNGQRRQQTDGNPMGGETVRWEIRRRRTESTGV
ncbi:hypothetical protein PVAR5_1873 [Paecilomyces variotii No. 5]|uniref:Uncharacterized protein n=1 Tax=Byssochlamys spectabilis (strain No. 5 / NBRC 109023) TaxID=1356009 RepID=V5HUH0_BYSSN|nr:hypothetical protein PVAR5_1873 [Paecilomyces variotii No. 5]